MLKLRYFLSLIFCFGAMCAIGNDASAQLIYDDGHGDIGVAYEGGALELHWHIAGGTVDGTVRADEEFEANELRAVTSLVFGTAGRPAGAAWDPIGNNAGDDTWYLPQANIAGTPFLGLASEELDPNDWTTDLTWAITGVSGPGEFSLFQVAAGPQFFASSVDGLDANDAFTRAGNIGGHDHYNYGFTEVGIYDITFEVSATHDTDGFQSDTATFQFEVIQAVPEPGSLSVMAMFGVVGLMRRRRRTA